MIHLIWTYKLCSPLLCSFHAKNKNHAHPFTSDRQPSDPIYILKCHYDLSYEYVKGVGIRVPPLHQGCQHILIIIDIVNKG